MTRDEVLKGLAKRLPQLRPQLPGLFEEALADAGLAGQQHFTAAQVDALAQAMGRMAARRLDAAMAALAELEREGG